MAFAAFLDACVLVPSTLRDVLLEIGCTDALRPLWSEQIEEEVEATVMRLRSKRGRDSQESAGYVRRLRRQMNDALPDARVSGWESAIAYVPDLPDPDDRHVVAAALVGRADVIVTFNLKDFPDEVLPGALFAQAPDEFLLDLLGLSPSSVYRALAEVLDRTGRKGPRWDLDGLLRRLERERLNTFADAVRQAWPGAVGSFDE